MNSAHGRLKKSTKILKRGLEYILAVTSQQTLLFHQETEEGGVPRDKGKMIASQRKVLFQSAMNSGKYT